LLKFNDDICDAFGHSLEKAHEKNWLLDPLTTNKTHLESFDHRKKLFSKITANRTHNEFRVKTKDGKSEVRVLSLQSPSTKGKKNLQAYISNHGGGNIGGNALDDADGFKNATFDTNAVYFFVDYRFAPFAKYPAQPEDAYVVIKELYNNPEKYGIDKNRIAIGGRSTGCTVALSAALMLQEKNEEHMLKGLYLFLPSINDIMWTDPQHSFN